MLTAWKRSYFSMRCNYHRWNIRWLSLTIISIKMIEWSNDEHLCLMCSLQSKGIFFGKFLLGFVAVLVQVLTPQTECYKIINFKSHPTRCNSSSNNSSKLWRELRNNINSHPATTITSIITTTTPEVLKCKLAESKKLHEHFMLFSFCCFLFLFHTCCFLFVVCFF